MAVRAERTSFREIVQGRQQVSPAWYNQGVERIAADQAADGSILDEASIGGGVVSTAFAVLFLVRGTQRAIGRLDEGLAFGGYELPSDVANIKLVGDRIVSDAEVSVESLLSLMETADNQVRESMLPANMQLSSDGKERAAQVARLARLLNSRNHTARQLAARLLGRSEDIQVAPDLIYALQDPDPYVPQIAEEGLRLLSRQLTVSHLKVNPSAEDKAKAVQYWKRWYLGLKPDYIFIDR